MQSRRTQQQPRLTQQAQQPQQALQGLQALQPLHPPLCHLNFVKMKHVVMNLGKFQLPIHILLWTTMRFAFRIAKVTLAAIGLLLTRTPNYVNF